MAVLLLESLHPEAEALLAECGPVVHAASDAHALEVARAGGVAGILTRGKGKITAELMQACGPSLRAVSRAGAGLDTVDVAAAAKLGVTVIFAPGMNAQTTAEHALLLMLMAGRKAAMLNANVKAGNWAVRNGYEGVELGGKTLGVVGLGNIGARVAQLGQAFGMRVIYWSRASRDGRFGYRDLDELLGEADVVSLHVALSDNTRRLIDARRLALLKPTAILVNTARGALIDQSALAQALETGRLGAFAADVLAEQPPPSDDPLLKSAHVTLTPHVAGLTDRTYREVCAFCARNVLAAIAGRPPDADSIYAPP
jgi:phosphoglycerate dehydrogenase-like enzyme